jgi:uncharacterized protein YcbK (DUF882 family)
MKKHIEDKHLHSRRGFLGTLVGVSGGLVMPGAFAAPASPVDRVLTFYNTHTGETLTSTYWSEGQYHQESLKEIGWLLRDHRADEAHPMDPKLLDTLHSLKSCIGKQDCPFHIISGYRSPQTNAKLRRNSAGVAKKSYHMQGKAIDIRVPGQDIAQVRRAALSLKAGGVGYYPKSNFIHLDTGRPRAW